MRKSISIVSGFILVALIGPLAAGACEVRFERMGVKPVGSDWVYAYEEDIWTECDPLNPEMKIYATASLPFENVA